MKKLIITLLFPTIAFSQVGINTEDPTKTLDVNGELRIRNTPLGDSTDYLLVVNSNGDVRKVPISIIGNNTSCPTLIRSLSTGYYLLFSSNSSIPNPNDSLVISGKTFVSAGTWISNNTYFFSYTNTSGTAININNFSVQFGTTICNYNQ